MGHSQKCYAFPARDRRFVETPPSVYRPPFTSKLATTPHSRLAIHLNSGQVTKGAGRMPWHQEPKKDVISCEKLRGGANIH